MFIRKIVSDYGSEKLASRIILHQQSEVQLIRWVFPPIGWVKLILMELRIVKGMRVVDGLFKQMKGLVRRFIRNDWYL